MYKSFDITWNAFVGLKWRYWGSSSAETAGSDGGWVDGICWEPTAVRHPTNIIVKSVASCRCFSDGTLNMETIMWPQVAFDDGKILSIVSYNNWDWNVTKLWEIVEPGVSATIDPYSGKFSANGYSGRVTVQVKFTEGDQTAFARQEVLVLPCTGTADLNAALDNDQLQFQTGGNTNWFAQSVMTKDGKSAAQNGRGVGDDSWIKTTVNGPGTLEFWWKGFMVSNAWNNTSTRYEFCIDGNVARTLTGDTNDWAKIIEDIPAGRHELLWRYIRVGGLSGWCGWLDCVRWTSENGPETLTTSVPVPHSWLASHPKLWERCAGDYENMAKAKTGKRDASGNEMSVWQDWVAGTDPEDEDSTFKAKVEMVDGKPVISWEPKLEPSEAEKRTYTTYGKKTLSPDEKWTSVSEKPDEDYHFFSVGVEMK